MGPKYSDIYPYKRESKEILHTGEEKKEEEAMGNVTKEAGIGTMQPQTKELQLPPKGVRGKGQLSLKPLEGEPSY